MLNIQETLSNLIQESNYLRFLLGLTLLLQMYSALLGCEESQGQKYESLLNNLSKSHPELAGNRRFFCTSMGLHVNTQPDICLTCSRYPEQNVKPQQGTWQTGLFTQKEGSLCCCCCCCTLKEQKRIRKQEEQMKHCCLCVCVCVSEWWIHSEALTNLYFHICKD